MKFLSIFPSERSRWLTHAGLAILTLFGCYIAFPLLPDTYKNVRVLAFATGYLALIFIAVTLLIGPLQLILQKRKRNPVNISLRRDIGIWAALTGLLHVIFGFQVHLQGHIILYFFTETDTGYLPRLNTFGASNYLGAVATIIVFVLLTLSNDVSMRMLKGKRWKRLQQLNYGLIILVLAHTFGYQIVSKREPTFQYVTIVLAVILLMIQATGFVITRQRRL